VSEKRMRRQNENNATFSFGCYLTFGNWLALRFWVVGVTTSGNEKDKKIDEAIYLVVN